MKLLELLKTLEFWAVFCAVAACLFGLAAIGFDVQAKRSENQVRYYSFLTAFS